MSGISWRQCAWCGIICLGLGSVPAAASQQLLFDVDPAQSVLQASASIHLFDIGLTIETEGQGNRGLSVPGFSDGTSGQVDGFLAAQVDWSSQSLVFGGGSLYGRPSGLWEPGPQGTPGVAAGFLGVLIESIGGLPTRAVASIRDFWADYANAYSSTSLAPDGSGGFSFITDHWLAVATNVDLQGQTGLAALLDPGRLVLEELYATRNQGTVGALAPGEAGGWQVTLPIDTSVFIDAGTVDGLGAIFVDLRIAGQIVGHTVELPPGPAAILSDGTNDSFLTALIIDDFKTFYDPQIGSALLNTSAIVPHATVLGTHSGGLDFFKFTMHDPGGLGLFDIDGADFDSQLFLFDAAGNLLASNDDAPASYGALGSLSSLDAFLAYEFADPGEYYLAVGRFTLPGPGLQAAAAVGQYALHISVSRLIPEPSTLMLAALGLAVGALAGLRRGRLRPAALALAAVLGLAPASSQAAPLAIKSSIEDVYDRGGTYPMGYRLFLPPGLDDSGGSFPLVLFLHGAGERGTDNYFHVTTHIDGLIQATQSAEFAAFLLAPQATDFPLAGGWSAASPYDRTFEILDDILSRYPVDPSRIYITGLSMGGFGTFNYLAAQPQRFAAAVPMSGGGSTATAATIKDVPLWVFHGALDNVVSVNGSRAMVQAITAAGGSPLYTEIATGGHDIWGAVYSDAQTQQYGLYEWMFAQSNPAASELAAPEPSSLVLAALGAGLAAWGARRRR